MKKMFDFWGSHVKKIPLHGLLCLFIMCLGLQTYAQQETGKINITVKDATVKEVLEIIKKHDYRLAYSTAVIDACKKKVTLDLKKATVTQILDEAFKGTNLVYNVEKNLITIKEVKKDESILATGIVKDEKGNPIPGVSVIIKGTITGTATDKDGKFQIKVSKNGALLFSFIGMEAKTVLVETNTPIVVVMKEIVSEMEEVVVTGFQVLKKRESTSSIVSLKAEDFIEPIGTSIDQMLQGKVPGMAVMQMTSTVGAAPKIRIRGSSTIMGSREPLWVLDGIVLEDPVQLNPADLNSMDQVNLIGNAISGLNPEDIERIDVLKDASATALYGTKAANGVIMITTKRGKMGDPSIRYSTSMSFMQRPTYDKLFLMNSKERIEVSEEMYERGLEFKGYTPKGVGYEGALQEFWGGELSVKGFHQRVKDLKEMNTDWYKLLFRNSFSHSHTLSVSGANEKADYYFSAGYSDQQGAPMQEKGDRFSFMSNVGFKVSERMRVTASLSANVSKTNRPKVDLYQYANTTSRAISAINADGSYAFYDKELPMATTLNTPLTFNIFNELENMGSINETRAITSNINVSYKVASWLNFGAIMSYNTSVNEQEDYVGERSFAASKYRYLPYGYDLSQMSVSQLATYKGTTCLLPYGGILGTDRTTTDAYMVRPSLSVNKSFNDIHSVSGSVGLDVMSTKVTGYQREDWAYQPDRGRTFVTLTDLGDWKAAIKRMQGLTPRITDNKKNTLSYYATAAYGFKSKYIISLNLRGDASNKLGDDKSARFKPIWSVSGRWNVTDELFLNPVLDYLSSLAIRSSWGIQANVTDAHNPNMIIGLGSLDAKSEEYKATLSSLPNHGLRWEKTRSFNIGVDFDLFKGIIVGSFEYYDKKSKDQLLSVDITSTNGAKMVTMNGGDLKNTGWDLSLSMTPVKTKNVTWRLTMNTGKVHNEVNNAVERSATYNDYLSGSIVRNGYALNSFYSYRYGGLDAKGIPTFLGLEEKDEAGQFVIVDKDQAFASALAYSGKREPDFNGGVTTSLRVKRLTLNMMFTLALGAKVRLNDLYESDGFKLPYPHQNMSSDFVNRWKNPGDEKFTDIPVLTDVTPTIYSQMGAKQNFWSEVAKDYWQMYNNSDLRVVSSNFLRCRSISLAYSLPENVLKHMYVKGVSLSFSVSNPFVIKAKGLKGRDPEQVGLGSGTLPPQKNYALMLNVTF